ncbi:exopolysaccharide biosynthesis protein [Plastorhodobacter daqingensis]|uniref:Exopolysaccharide biosynthesis protein n=1 Tax=Plastorhodobacter daqingensis TaxID=1387281 RepID=A0ABW2UMF4_9RHOB
MTGSDGDENRKIAEVLDGLDEAGDEESVSVEQVVEAMGDRSFAPLLLVPALIMVSPISSIPGTPTISGLIIGLIAVQMLIGRDSLWLPGFLRRRKVSSKRMHKAVDFLRKPVSYVDPVLKERLTFLTDKPANTIALLTCVAITLVMPLMEFVPMLASVAALAISLFAAGLLIRDGLLVGAGYVVVAIGIATTNFFI